MKNKRQPKLSEEIESLCLQLDIFKKEIEKGNNSIKGYTSKLSNIKIEFNLDRYSEIRQQNNLYLEKLFQEFEKRHKTYNDEFIARTKKNSLVKPVYIILTLIFLLLTTGLSLYTVGAKSNQIQNFETYLIENPDAAKHYRKWLRN